ncbi:MAG TPA: VOC family protein [Terracidiphilus sp.]
MARLLRIAPELPTLNLKSALAFYEHKMGFRVAMLTPGDEYAIVERDGIAIHLFQDGLRKHSPVGIHIFTNELEGLRDDFIERGARLWQDIMRKPWGNRDFRVHDDFGNELKFTEPISED